jgi:hypothetical protein
MHSRRRLNAHGRARAFGDKTACSHSPGSAKRTPSQQVAWPLERRRVVGVEEVSKVPTGGVVGWTHDSVGVVLETATARGSRSYVAGEWVRAHERGWAPALFWPGRVGGFEAQFRTGPINGRCRACERVWASRQPVRVGLCARMRQWPRFRHAQSRNPIGAPGVWVAAFTGDGPWAGCSMCIWPVPRGGVCHSIVDDYCFCLAIPLSRALPRSAATRPISSPSDRRRPAITHAGGPVMDVRVDLPTQPARRRAPPS